MTRLGTLAALALLLASPAARGGDDPASLCGGRFVVEGAPLLPDASFEGPDVVELGAGSLSIASGCSAPSASVRASRDGTHVRARLFEGRAVAAHSRFGLPSFRDEMAALSWNVLTDLTGAAPAGRGACGPAKWVRLEARIDADCTAMTGVVRARSPRLRREFVAHATSQPLCTLTEPCAGDGFCEVPAGVCTSPLDAGICVDVGDACPELYQPVCGCDGVTYGNDCERRRARVQKSTDGACAGSICGTIAGLPCPDGAFCELPEATCASADLAGTCVPQAEACTLQWDPVCGCDGRTYGNDCERQAAGVSKDRDGECDASGPEPLDGTTARR